MSEDGLNPLPLDYELPGEARKPNPKQQKLYQRWSLILPATCAAIETLAFDRFGPAAPNLLGLYVISGLNTLLVASIAWLIGKPMSAETRWGWQFTQCLFVSVGWLVLLVLR